VFSSREPVSTSLENALGALPPCDWPKRRHALSLGRVAGYNATAELLGLPLHRYSQPKYVTCIDLGPWGGLYTEGWDRQVHLTRDKAKALKIEINTKWIYPPAANREAAFATANPDYVIVP
jgi:NADH dehydrogenase